MQQQRLKIRTITHVTHNVLRIVTAKPERLRFTPGQAADISINKEGWREETRPFTFTCLPGDGYLEFTIKTYPSHKGVTNQLRRLKKNDELILHGVFGAIRYKGTGTFVAGGAGVTPFISILRHLQSKKRIGRNKLIFANKTKKDIILGKEFKKLLGKNFINILSEEKAKGHYHGYITEEFLQTHGGGTDHYWYLCGPPPMMKSVEKQLKHLKVKAKHIVKEAF